MTRLAIFSLERVTIYANWTISTKFPLDVFTGKCVTVPSISK